MTDIFAFDHPVDFLKSHLESLPKKGHGKLSEWAKALSVSTTLLSQIVKGNKFLSLELADGLAELMGLTQKETDYFFLLVQVDRAGTQKLKARFKARIKESQAMMRQLKNRVEDSREISEAIRTQYYSSWIYSGVRNLAVCEGVKSADEIALRLFLSRSQVVEVLEFLERAGLLSSGTQGFEWGVKSTYLSSDSPLISKHHQNWRLKAVQKMDDPSRENLFYTSPMSLSQKVALELRSHLVKVIEDIHKKTDPSPSEVVRCLSIDWFEY